MCRAIRGERIECLVLDEDGAAQARAAIVGTEFGVHRVEFGDVWLRDTGPVTVFDSGGRCAALSFHFNGWGGKYRLDGDADVAAKVAALQGLPLRAVDLVCEGGAIESDGEGTLLTTRQCLLNDNRNPGLGEYELEALFAAELGAEKVVWLDRGLANDHTDGHVDTLARFVAPAKVLCMQAEDTSDPNREALQRVVRDLERASDARGRRFEVRRIPSPGRVVDRDGSLMPASYLNFYIANGSVVVPVYGCEYDAEAVRGIAECFPGRTVVGLSARSILTGGGAFHCITQQEVCSKTATDGENAPAYVTTTGADEDESDE